MTTSRYSLGDEGISLIYEWSNSSGGSTHQFLRIHRAHVVNLDFVSHLEPFDVGRLQVTMREGPQRRQRQEGVGRSLEMICGTV
jgi:hypothetical protein